MYSVNTATWSLEHNVIVVSYSFQTGLVLMENWNELKD